MSGVQVIKISASPLNGRPEFRMTLTSASAVVRFYLRAPTGTTPLEREFNYPCTQIEKESDTSYVFRSPRLTTPGIWSLEWLTDFGARESLNPMQFRVYSGENSLLLADVAAWEDQPVPEQPVRGMLPMTLPGVI